jgi:outer membrane receptor protein involved in Fe transport
LLVIATHARLNIVSDCKRQILGFPTSGNVPVPGFVAYGSHYYAVFVQDDWKVTSRLTVNLGLRWDYESPMTERYNRLNAGFAFNSLSPVML